MRRPVTGGFSLLEILIVALVLIFLAIAVVPSFVRRGCGGQQTACKSNLKNIGTGMEMYASDYSGHYPRNLALLTPNYLKTIPECPAAGRMTYRMTRGHRLKFSPLGFEEYYLVECSGENHAYMSTPRDYPKYDSIAIGRGAIPTSLEMLTPRYLKTLPKCPSARRLTYKLYLGPGALQNDLGFEDHYFLKCEGEWHRRAGVPRNNPNYNGMQGGTEP